MNVMHQGIPEEAEVPPVARIPASVQPSNAPAVNPPVQPSQPAAPAGGPNANPLDLFPQVDTLLPVNFGLCFLWSSNEIIFILLESGPSKYGLQRWCWQLGFPPKQSTGIQILLTICNLVCAIAFSKYFLPSL